MKALDTCCDSGYGDCGSVFCIPMFSFPLSPSAAAKSLLNKKADVKVRSIWLLLLLYTPLSLFLSLAASLFQCNGLVSLPFAKDTRSLYGRGLDSFELVLMFLSFFFCLFVFLFCLTTLCVSVCVWLEWRMLGIDWVPLVRLMRSQTVYESIWPCFWPHFNSHSNAFGCQKSARFFSLHN